MGFVLLWRPVQTNKINRHTQLTKQITHTYPYFRLSCITLLKGGLKNKAETQLDHGDTKLFTHL